MKRLIVIISVALMAGCALALAEDSNNANTDSLNSGTNTSQETTTVKKMAKNAKTCTDDSGNTFKKGEDGFKSCWKAQHPKQESGTAAKNDNNTNNKMQSDTDESHSNEGSY